MRPTSLMPQRHPATSRVYLAAPPTVFRLAAHGFESPHSTMVWSDVLVAAFSLSDPRHLDPTLVQLAELLRGWDPRPAQTISPNSTIAPPYLHCLMSSKAAWARHSHSESRDEQHRMPNHPADEVMTQRHFATDARFESRFERAQQASHFTIPTLDGAVDWCDSTAVLSTKVSAHLAVISSSNVVNLHSCRKLLKRVLKPQTEP